ncbi:glycosyl hydrolase [Apiospora marii]|uniref:Glycosyl hydrolase n=1 Tax=Apiospora marii TaxID=335849 RepID=A0ABR1SB28_9PEZI
MLVGLVISSACLLGSTAAAFAPIRRQGQACTAALVIDDFSKWAENTNSLDGATSDDGTMNATSVDGGILTFTPSETVESYIYEQFGCTTALAQGYDTLSFDIKGPEAASVSLEIQTQPNCDPATTEYNSTYFTIDGLSGTLETIQVPLNSWPDANLDAVIGFLWYGFSKGLTGTDNVWQLDNVQLLCGGTPAPPPPTDPVPTTTTTVAPPPPPTVTVTVTVSPPPPPPPPTTTTTRRTTRRTTTRRPTSSCRWWDWECEDDDDDWWDGASRATAPPGPTPRPDPPKPTGAPGPPEVQRREIEEREIAARQDGECSILAIDDFASQSRLTFLYYNALLKSSSDDGTMKSVVVRDNKVTFTPKNTDSYWYTQVGCMDARNYGGISLRISAPAGSQFDVQLASTKGACGTEDAKSVTLTTRQLGWTFDGSEKLYSIPFGKFSGIDLSKLETFYISNLKKPVSFGPVALYCGDTVREFVVKPPVQPSEPTATVGAPPSKATNMVVDQFKNANTNALGEWHGGDEGLSLTFRNNKMTLKTNDSDLMWNTQLTEKCRDMRDWQDAYLHIAYSGSNKFSIALQQHNEKCDDRIQPFPETWDSLEAARYSDGFDIYIPMNHFNVNFERLVGFALKGFYTTDATVFSKLEIVNKVPGGWTVPEKLPSGRFVFACTRPNSFAFAIDDGDPAFARQVMDTIKEEDIKVTFFTVGAALQDPSTNLSSLYNDMAARGHQVAMHSYTHPALEGLPDEASIDWEYSNMIRAVASTFDGMHTPYFRAPFGTEGARMRQRLAAVVDEPYIVQWSVDVEDWLWAESDTPEKQLEAFKRDVNKGGNLVVMHYLYPSTVGYLKQFIQIAKATGKQLMRVDQCMEDPNAPPL